MSAESSIQKLAIAGPLFAVIGVLCFSVNDVSIKFLSGDYALHLVVLFRSLFAFLFLLIIVVPLVGSGLAFRTSKLKLHIARGLCVVTANLTFFLGLAAMPLADAVAIFFVAPLLITIFSVVFLGEQVGPRRWAAIAIGLAGVLIMFRPGLGAFQPAALFPLVAATAYALVHILARKLGPTESAVTMAFYIQITFIVVCAVSGLILGHGRFDAGGDPSMEFLLRAWTWPALDDFPILIAIGLGTALGGYFISQAYRVSEAAIVAPFEYIAIPVSIIWGIVVFGEWPDLMAWAGIALILASGLYMAWREAVLGRRTRPHYRR